jgi:ribosome maturation factor RimP
LLKESVQKLIEEIIEGTELFLVDVRSGTGKTTKITILLDSDEGISIEQCAKISRELSQKLEEMEVGDSPFTLEISSPGLEEPLKSKRQYFKNLNRQLSVTLIDGSQKKGKLIEVKDESIILGIPEKKKQEELIIEIAFSEIKKSNIIVSFK